MRRNGTLLIFAAILSFSAWFVLPSMAQDQEIKTTSVQLGDNVAGILYEPVTPTAKSQIAVYVMHTGVDYTNFSACTELAKRGYCVLCARNSVDSVANKDGIDRKILDAKLGVEYLRKYPGVKKIVLLGHSGGGMLMSAYQNIAENGLSACQGPEKIIKCSDSLAGLPPADGIMLLDAHWGDGISNFLFSMSPSMTDEVSSDLDPRNAKNGYSAGESKYSDEFLRRYQTQIGKKMNQIFQDALAEYKASSEDKIGNNENDLFSIPGINGTKLLSHDTHLLSHTHNAWPLLHADGSVTTEIVYSVRPSKGISRPMGTEGSGGQGGPGGQGGGPSWQRFTLREFLNTYAIRVTDDFAYGEDYVRGIDWTSSYANPPGNVKGIKVPLLTMGMTGSYEYLASELIYQNAKSIDKTITFVEGASHMFGTCTQCEKTPGQYGDTQKTLYDYIDKWLSKSGRFLNNTQ